MALLLFRLWTFKIWFGIPPPSPLDLSSLVSYFAPHLPLNLSGWFGILFSSPLDPSGLVWYSFFFAFTPNRFDLAFLLLLLCLWTSQVWFGIPSSSLLEMTGLVCIPSSSLLDLSGLVWHSFYFFASGHLRFGLAFLLLLRLWTSQVWFGIISPSLLDS